MIKMITNTSFKSDEFFRGDKILESVGPKGSKKNGETKETKTSYQNFARL
jgi:hypothetical protein